MKSNNNLDSILGEIGELGKFQRRIVLLLMLLSMVRYFPIVIYVFETTPVNHRCKINECDSEPTEYNPTWLKNAVPFKNEKPEKCSKFKIQYNSSCEASSFNTSVIEPCNAFVYESSQVSIIQDFNLQCDINLKALTLVGTVNGIAKFIGLPLTGLISDRYGRKKVLIWTILLSAFFGILRSVSTSYYSFMVYSFIDSLFSAGSYATIYVLGLEFVGPKKRALVSTLQFLSYGFGSIVLGSTAWLIQSWRTLLQVLYSLYVLVVAYYWLLPESVRWLLTRNRQQEAIQILRKIAKVNGKSISTEKLENLLNSNASTQRMPISVIDLFKSSTLLIRCCMCSFCWLSCILVYYGFVIISITLSKNHYFDFILTAAIETPANIACLYMLNKGRKRTFLIALVMCSVSSVAFVAMPTDTYWVKLLVYLMGKFGITMAVSTIYIITNETFPTPVRQTALSICSMVGRTGNILAPQLLLLVDIWQHLPLILFATLTGVSSVVTIFLPESSGVTLPDTIEGAENVGREKLQKVIECDSS